jgi:hypothetical protein
MPSCLYIIHTPDTVLLDKQNPDIRFVLRHLRWWNKSISNANSQHRPRACTFAKALLINRNPWFQLRNTPLKLERGHTSKGGTPFFLKRPNSGNDWSYSNSPIHNLRLTHSPTFLQLFSYKIVKMACTFSPFVTYSVDLPTFTLVCLLTGPLISYLWSSSLNVSHTYSVLSHANIYIYSPYVCLSSACMYGDQSGHSRPPVWMYVCILSACIYEDPSGSTVRNKRCLRCIAMQGNAMRCDAMRSHSIPSLPPST